MKKQPPVNSFVMNEVPKPIYRFLRDNFKCVGCGKCCHCTPIAITGKDIRVMACKLGMGVKEFKKQYTEVYPGHPGLSHFKQENPCAFLDEHNRCKIYDARPDTCRFYPLMKGSRIPRECHTLLDLLQETTKEKGDVTAQSLLIAQQRRLIKASLHKDEYVHTNEP